MSMMAVALGLRIVALEIHFVLTFIFRGIYSSTEPGVTDARKIHTSSLLLSYCPGVNSRETSVNFLFNCHILFS